MDNVQQLWDERCEQQVLQNCMNYYEAYIEAKEYVDDTCFYADKHKAVWRAIENAASKGVELSVVTVFAELTKINSSYKFDLLTEINRENLYTLNVITYAARLRELAIRRKLWILGNKIMQAGIQESTELDVVRQNAVDEIRELFDTHGVEEVTLTQAFKELIKTVNENQKNEGVVTGSPTGIGELDKRGGLQEGDLIIIGGGSSNGKTALALKIALSVIQNDEHVAFYSMEMTNRQLSARMASLSYDISSSELLYSNHIPSSKIDQVEYAIQQVKSDNLHLDEKSTSNIDNILVSIRKMKAKFGISGAIVDYLQITNVNTAKVNKEQAIAEAARKLKNIAKELGIWVIALSQINRRDDDPEPTLARLRDSGQIVEAADDVILVYRPELYGKNFPEPFDRVATKGLAQINLAKGRNIGTAKFLMGFNPQRTLFYDVDMTRVPKKNDKENDAPF